MKALFITGSDFSDDTYGGPKGSIRNHLLLEKYFDVDVYLVKKKSTLRSVKSILQGYFPPTEKSDIDSVRDWYDKNKYQLVFLDGSTYGEFIKIFECTKTKIVVFYHNCQHDYMEVRFGAKCSLKKVIYSYLNDRSEKISTDEADVCISFSDRDAERIKELYGRTVQFTLPLTIVDKYDKRESDIKEKSCLLFGPIGAANIEAFAWFVERVSPYLHCKTVVAGKGFEKYKLWESENVSVIGFVDSIVDLYGSVSCVAIPLLTGGGMKVKTVEAMMFGKSIFGTDEAFVGYDVDFDKIGALCNDAGSFIEKINAFIDNNETTFNVYSRELYVEKYCVEASDATFENIMKYLEFNKEGL